MPKFEVKVQVRYFVEAADHHQAWDKACGEAKDDIHRADKDVSVIDVRLMGRRQLTNDTEPESLV